MRLTLQEDKVLVVSVDTSLSTCIFIFIPPNLPPLAISLTAQSRQEQGDGEPGKPITDHLIYSFIWTLVH